MPSEFNSQSFAYFSVSHFDAQSDVPNPYANNRTAPPSCPGLWLRATERLRGVSDWMSGKVGANEMCHLKWRQIGEQCCYTSARSNLVDIFQTSPCCANARHYPSLCWFGQVDNKNGSVWWNNHQNSVWNGIAYVHHITTYTQSLQWLFFEKKNCFYAMNELICMNSQL